MQILATSIRNTVITQILPETQPELRMPPPWTIKLEPYHPKSITIESFTFHQWLSDSD